MRPQDLWVGQGAKQRLARLAATPLSWLYALGWEAYLATYTLKIKKAASPHRPIICVGSLAVGGSGKTPVSLHIVRLLKGMGRSVVIGCNGYRGRHADQAAIAPAGPLSAAEWGDEPAMFRWLEPDVPIVVGRRRVDAAQLVHQTYPDAALVMDDGFQHLPLAKQLTVLLDDVEPPNRGVLPAGPHREPRHNRKRADLIVPEDFELVREPMRLVSPEGKSVSVAKYAVLCGLGQPDQFLSALAANYPNQTSPTPAVLMPDHDPLTAPDLWAGLPEGWPIVVTAKDWVKLRERPDVCGRQFFIALQDVRLEPTEEFKICLVNSFDG